MTPDSENFPRSALASFSRSDQMLHLHLKFQLRQGLGYSGDSTAKVLTKFCTPNDSPKKYYRSKTIFKFSTKLT